ncbi:hypothetical protein BH10BAC5_BH10BAC5_21420 [soil metagenome]
MLNFIKDITYNLGKIRIEIAIAAGVFILFILFSFLAAKVAKWINTKFCKHSLHPVLSIRFVRWIFSIWGLLAALYIIHKGFTANDIYYYEPFFKLIIDLTFIAAVIYITIIAYKFIYYAIEKYIRMEKGYNDRNISTLAGKVLKLMLGMIALIIILDHYDININSFVVSLGIGSFAIAFAAQETLSNFISGVVILIDRPFVIGDTIKTSSGSVGKVEYIGLRTCKILTLEDKYLIIPNTELTKSSILNYREKRSKYKIRFNFFIPFTFDIDEFKSELLSRVKEGDLIMNEPAPSFVYQGMTTDSFEITVVCFTSKYENDLNATNFVKETIFRIINEFKKSTHAPIHLSISNKSLAAGLIGNQAVNAPKINIDEATIDEAKNEDPRDQSENSSISR